MSDYHLIFHTEALAKEFLANTTVKPELHTLNFPILVDDDADSGASYLVQVTATRTTDGGPWTLAPITLEGTELK